MLLIHIAKKINFLIKKSIKEYLQETPFQLKYKKTVAIKKLKFFSKITPFRNGKTLLAKNKLTKREETIVMKAKKICTNLLK